MGNNDHVILGLIPRNQEFSQVGDWGSRSTKLESTERAITSGDTHSSEWLEMSMNARAGRLQAGVRSHHV